MTYPGAPSYVSGRLLHRGAEADLLAGDWQGRKAVFKVRNPLPYRLPILDDLIRRRRTLREAEMIHRARSAGVAVPRVYNVDPGSATIVMELVAGQRVKERLSGLAPPGIRKIFRMLGAATGCLHKEGVVHGDLTTANAILRDGEVVLIDFGLAFASERVEDHAVDLRLIKETLAGAHPSAADDAFSSLVEGYESQVGTDRDRAVLKQLRSIERRGRYARVV